MHVRLSLIRLAVTLALLAAPTLAEAVTYYVGKSGSDANSCVTAQSSTAANRKLTVVAGIACLAGGDTLIIGDGTYNEGIVQNTIPAGSGTGTEAVDGVWAGATTIKAENRRLAIVKATTSSHCGGAVNTLVVIGSRSYVILEGLGIDANRICPAALRWAPTTGQATTTYLRLLDVEVMNAVGSVGGVGMVGRGVPNPNTCAQWAIFVDQYTKFHLKNSDLHDHDSVAPYTGIANHLMYDYPSESIIEGNNLWNVSGSALTNHNGSRNATIRNNTIYNTGLEAGTLGGNADGAGIRLSGYASALGGCNGGGVSNNVAYNNVIYDAANSALTTTSQAPIVMHLAGVNGNKAYNNTIHGNKHPSGYCITMGAATTNSEAKNNICYGATAAGGDIMFDGNASGGNVFTSNRCATGCQFAFNPLFTNAATKDFTLQSTSPAIDVGLTIAIVTTDRAGVARPQGAAYDLGAYEFTAGGGGACPASVGLLARYWLDEAASGQSPTVAVDTGPAPTVALTWTYAGAGQPDYTSVATGRGVNFGTISGAGKAEASIDGTKVKTQLHGCKMVTFTVIIDFADATPFARVVQIGAGVDARLSVLAASDTTIRLAIHDTYLIDFPYTFASEGRDVLTFVVDTAQATEANRVLMYKGTASVAASSGNYPPQNTTFDLLTGQSLVIGNRHDQVRSPQGKIYYVSIHDTALSSGDVTTNATALDLLDDATPVTPPADARPTYRRGRIR